MSVFKRGDNGFEVPMTMFAENRKRLCKRLKEDNAPNGSWVLLQGGIWDYRYPSSDVQPIFRQESYFHWAFGVEEEDCYGAIEVATGRSVLFMPKLSDDYGIWVGRILPLDHYKKKYEVDEVHYVEEMLPLFENGLKVGTFLLLNGVNTDNNCEVPAAHFDGIEKFTIDKTTLWESINECRVIKTQKEIELLRYVSKISCDAHKELMKRVKPGLYEFHAESIFQHLTSYNGGARLVAYNCISAVGENCAVLHFVQAKRKIEDGDMCLFDMGAEYCCYAADITCSFPANGQFTDNQKIIYNAVYDANKQVMETMKPGVNWLEMHKLSERVLLKHLLKAGIVHGSIDEMMEARVCAIFMPHGLGHMMGIDVHDCGGYPKGTSRIMKPGLKNLRCMRDLKAGMCVTVEPGCYFIDHVLDKAIADPELSKFLCPVVIQRFRGSGGVRIEDDVMVTETGVENLSADLPRTIEEIEAFMANRS